MNLEAQVARLDTLEALIELLSAEYNGILEEVSEEWDFITSAIERGIVIETYEEPLSDIEKMLDAQNTMLHIINTYDMV
jgi:hypothetical protein